MANRSPSRARLTLTVLDHWTFLTLDLLSNGEMVRLISFINPLLILDGAQVDHMGASGPCSLRCNEVPHPAIHDIVESTRRGLLRSRVHESLQNRGPVAEHPLQDVQAIAISRRVRSFEL